MTQSSAGLWDYSQCHHPASYGDDTTYRIGAKWLEGLSIEDWGCGLGWFKKFHTGGYVGIDGSPSEASDIVADLSWPGPSTPDGAPEGIFMRHVLEHNRNWRMILTNAVREFQKRLCIVVSTPFEETETTLTPVWEPIPDISLPRADFAAIVWGAGCSMAVQVVSSQTRWGAETVFLVEKRG